MSKVVGYVPGVFDLFHVGHLNALRQARSMCDVLIAGVVSDEVCEATKGIVPTVPLIERLEIVKAIGIVDDAYVEVTTDKRDAWREVGFHRIFKGDDWKGTAKGARLEQHMAEVGVEVVYFPYTMHTSSTALRRHLDRGDERVVTAPTSAEAAAGGVRVDDRGVLVTAQGTGPLVLSVEGRYVWSLTPERDGTAQGGGWLVAWPHVLERFLHGTGRISVGDVTGETVYFDGSVTLGNGEGELSVLDGEGYPLSVDKVGHLTRSFAATDEGIRDEILDGTQRVLRDLRETCKVEAYLNYGALLGTIRDGAMIAHDSDTDVCYLSRHESPADLIAESYKIERTMRELGWVLLRMSGGDIKVLLPLSDGRVCHIDIFVAFYVRGTFYQLGNRSGQLPREVILPVSEVELHGYTFPAPAQPERMLAFLYGENWRVPDPSFKYDDPVDGVRRLNGWLRGFRTTMGLWTEFWSSPRAEKVAKRSSSFGRWVAPQLGEGDAIVDIGCGNARDAVRFAKRGHRVWAVDFSRGALRAATRRIRRHEVEIPTEQLIVGELRHVLTFGARLARDPHHVYARRLVNAIDAAAREQLWQLCAMGLRDGKHKLFLEFSAMLPPAEGARVLPDPSLDTDGRERRVDPDRVVAEIKDRGGIIEHLEVGPGVDLFDRPDPAVCRIRASWPSPKGSNA